MTASETSPSSSGAGIEASEEVTLTCSDGVKLAAQRWRRQTDDQTIPHRRVLCIHGWLDNARSFYRLAPFLVSNLPSTEVVALELPGHGLSSHKSLDGPSMLLSEYAFYVAEAVAQLGWEATPFTLVGHSMGAAVSTLYAASFPEQVDKLILLEGAGPPPKNPLDIAKHVRCHIDRRRNGNLKPYHKSVYPSLKKAVETRQATAQSFPGKQYISEQAAYELVRRASEDLPDGKIQFLHDQRLKDPSIMYFTAEQTESLYRDTQCDTLLLIGKDGWPFGEEVLKQVKQALQPSMFAELPGSHHFHMDAHTADKVAETLIEFLVGS
jgi:pimeloyl-ACP methyl ester carboxylesterase